MLVAVLGLYWDFLKLRRMLIGEDRQDLLRTIKKHLGAKNSATRLRWGPQSLTWTGQEENAAISIASAELVFVHS